MPIKSCLYICLALLLCPTSFAGAKIYQAPLPAPGDNQADSYNFNSSTGYQAPPRSFAPANRQTISPPRYYQQTPRQPARPQSAYMPPRAGKTYATPYNGGGYPYRTHYNARGNGTYATSASPLRHDYYYSPATPVPGTDYYPAPPETAYPETVYKARRRPARPLPTYSPAPVNRSYNKPADMSPYYHLYP